MTYNYPIVIEKDADGYFAHAPDLQGCYTQDDTYEEVLENIREAVELSIEDRLEAGEELPPPRTLSITTLEVAVGAQSSAFNGE